MVAFLIALHVFVCIALILIVLLQPGNKQGMGAAMGGGGAQTVFGGRGANTFLSKLTVGLATVFMLNSLVLVYVSSDTGSVTDKIAHDGDKAKPAVETPPSPEQEAAHNSPQADQQAAAPSDETKASDEGGANDEGQAAQPAPANEHTEQNQPAAPPAAADEAAAPSDPAAKPAAKPAQGAAAPKADDNKAP